MDQDQWSPYFLIQAPLYHRAQQLTSDMYAVYQPKTNKVLTNLCTMEYAPHVLHDLPQSGSMALSTLCRALEY